MFIADWALVFWQITNRVTLMIENYNETSKKVLLNLALTDSSVTIQAIVPYSNRNTHVTLYSTTQMFKNWRVHSD